jgi:hypothetical protein
MFSRCKPYGHINGRNSNLCISLPSGTNRGCKLFLSYHYSSCRAIKHQSRLVAIERDGQTGDKARMDLFSLPRTASGTEGVAKGHTEIYNYASGLHCSRPFISIMRRLRGCVDIGRSSAVTTRRGNLRVIILLTKLV